MSSVFDLPDRLRAKADPSLLAADERFFAVLADTLTRSIDEVSERLATVRLSAGEEGRPRDLEPGGAGQGALDRDQETHRLTARLRMLRRFALDLCLGHMVADTGAEPVFIGRLGLTGSDGRRLLVDWRSPAAEPFFGATHANPMGLVSRRRYRWHRGRIRDYWDEVFVTDAFAGPVAALDDQSAFIASLGSARSPQMRDVLGTIQADQDAIIRAGSDGALVVDGGPGTGKTVVALHRAAYLLYSDPRLGHHRGGVLVVGPHQPYLAYVDDVLPSLGEEGVQTGTLRSLVAEGERATVEPEPEVAWLKASAQLVRAVETAVRFYEEPPADGMTVGTDWDEVWLSPEDWAEAFAAAEDEPHNQARDRVWEELVAILAEKHEETADPELVRRSIRRNRPLLLAFNRAWPLLEAADLVGDLWSVPAFLRHCAPWLAPAEVQTLQRVEARAWTVSDLPLLDAARQRLGDPEAVRRRRRQEAATAAESRRLAQVVDDLLASDEFEEGVLSMFAAPDARGAVQGLMDAPGLDGETVDPLAGPFAHIVVDEAQELTDAEWQMLLLRCPARSFTIVGDRAQARHGFTESWSDRLERLGLDRITVAALTINYRTPEEVMAVAEPVIRTVLPDANVPTSIRRSGNEVRHAPTAECERILDDWLATHDQGIACVVGDPGLTPRPRVSSLSPELTKGLEFDLVILVEPSRFGTGIEGAVDRYVAMTRTTSELVILSG